MTPGRARSGRDPACSPIFVEGENYPRPVVQGIIEMLNIL